MTECTALYRLPNLRRHISTCELCGHSVLVFECLVRGPCVVDPSPYQRLIAGLIVRGSKRPSYPPFWLTPGYPVPHVCPPIGESPLDDLDEILRVLNRDDDGGKEVHP